MVKDASDFEVHLTDTTVAAVLELLETELGPLELDCYLNATEALYNAGDIEIMLDAQVEDGLISLWLRGPLPWEAEIELAHLLSKRLRCTARCAPGATYPAEERAGNPAEPRVYLQVVNGEESFIEWG